MSRLLLIAACCLVAAVCLFDSVQGRKSCLKTCNANCVKQHRERNRNLNNCQQKCQWQAAVCDVCTSPRNCLKCRPNYTQVKRHCVGSPPVQCLAGIQVLYTDVVVNEPSETIKEFHGGNNSLNAGFNGFTSWLTPLWQTGRDQAITGIDVIITVNATDGYSDVAKGDGLTYYRYLDPVREPSAPCINEITVWRSDDALQTPDSDGYQGYTTDINDGRGGGYLYLAWKLA